jgi:tetratricopeptide (TPR) repeat protein
MKTFLKINTEHATTEAGAPRYALVFLLVLLSLLSYAQTFNYDFCYDDDRLVLKRAEDYKNPRFLSIVFKVPFWGFSPTGAGNYYRPIVTLTYWLNYMLFGLKPGYYHALNLLVHTANGILLFFIILRISGRKELSFFTSALFLTHPIHTASVAWISGRTDLLALMFMLLAYLFFVEARVSKNPWPTSLGILTGSAFLSALLCKEAVLLFPAIMIVSDGLGFLSKETGKKKWPLLLPYLSAGLALLFYFGLRSNALHSSLPPDLFKEALSWKAIFHIPSIVTYYVKAMLYPVVFYLQPHWIVSTSLSDFSMWLAWLIFLGLIAAFILARQTSIRIGLCIFFATVIPVLYSFVADNPVNEYWAYLPSVGFAVILGAGLYRLNQWKKAPVRLGTALSILVLLLYVPLCWLRNPHLKDNIALFTDGIKRSPDKTVYYLNLGAAYAKKGDLEKAKTLWERALTIDPKTESANSNLGIYYVKKGDLAKAIEYFEKELLINPDYIPALLDIGKTYLSAGQPEKAIPYLEKTLAIDPKFAPVELNKIAMYSSRQAGPGAAIRIWEIIVKDVPAFPEAYISLGTAYAKAGQYPLALSMWKRFISSFPDHPKLHEVQSWVHDLEKRTGMDNQ